MAGSNSPKSPITSLEAALDEERREVMAALEGTSARTTSPSAARARTATPPPPVRSMLDVDTSRTPRHGSIAGIGVGITAGASPPAKLNPSDPSTYTSRHLAFDNFTSPTEALMPAHDPARRSSEAGIPPSSGMPKTQDIGRDHQFDMSRTTTRQAVPLRASQGEKRPREGSSSAMAAAISGDFSSLHVGMPKGAGSGRHNSTVGIGGKSKSPSSRIGRPDSPSTLSPPTSPQTYVTDSGKVINMDQAYRRLSNKSGTSGSFSTINSESEMEARVSKDEIPREGDEAAVESSEEEEVESSSEEESARERGRRRARRKKGSGSDADWGDAEAGEDSTLGMGKAGGLREAQSQMTAVEEERVAVTTGQSVKPLVGNEPSISVTGPSGEKVSTKKAGVHPNTSFDQSASVATSAASSDAEDMTDINKARKLGLNVSAVDQNVPDRVVRVILRGDWQSIQQEADDGRRRQRLYIVATDLSEEAVYALEWTIGTILRDGDTLLAFYAMGDETAGSGSNKSSEADREAFTTEGTKAAREAEKTMANLTAKTTTAYTSVNTLSPTSYVPATETDSISGSVDSRRVSKAQRERIHAVEDISSTCVRLLRKTRLQVRICVEVVTCRSPKHLITGAIDELDPTLVILGSRGRSALKGVLLGSFSNYLVTKSSVPVMVARKKLRKHAKVKGTRVRLTNNLTLSGTGGARRKLEHAEIELNPRIKRS